jgi:Asp-tRNA(Asn)/Glu-tRNA(Gln) amidotransferase C subunit
MQERKRSCRLEETPISIIRDNIVRSDRSCSSISEFIERAIVNQVRDISTITTGGSIVRKQVRHLNRIEGFNEPVPECRTDAKWSNKIYKDKFQFTVSDKYLRKVNRIETDTGLDQSVIFRCCTYKHLSSISNGPKDVFEYDRKAEQIKVEQIEPHWHNIESILIAPQTQFYFILLRRFRICNESTLKLIRNDERRFKHFADIYEEFYDSNNYHKIKDWCGEEGFNSVERIIEEETDHYFSK